jgi:serine/threonine-protein kinase RsbT
VSAEVRVPIEHESDIVTARQKGRELAASMGFSNTDQTIVALAISEITRNIISYAQRGEIAFTRVDDGPHRGILIVAEDSGPGIQDIALAKSLGMGLPGARRVMDEFDVVSAPGRGTTVTMKKWLR